MPALYAKLLGYKNFQVQNNMIFYKVLVNLQARFRTRVFHTLEQYSQQH